MAHTPGPWLRDCGTVYALNNDPLPINRFTAQLDRGWSNDSKRTSNDEIICNAMLIAAAPELLEALEIAVDKIKSGLILLKCDDEFIEKETRQALSAIAKAKGLNPDQG